MLSDDVLTNAVNGMVYAERVPQELSVRIYVAYFTQAGLLVVLET